LPIPQGGATARVLVFRKPVLRSAPSRARDADCTPGGD